MTLRRKIKTSAMTNEDRVGKGKKGKNEPKTQLLRKPEKKEQKQEEQIKSVIDSRGSDDSGTCR